MKSLYYYVATFACLLTSCAGFAQTFEGVIEYEVKVNLHRTLPPERAEMKSMIPEFRTSKQQLFFNAQESLFKPVIEDEDPMEASGGGVQIRMQQPHIEIYFDAASQRRLIEEEFMGKDYLIEDSIAVLPWKFSAETRKVMNYDCQKASYYDEVRKQQVTAWYTNKLRPFLGPEFFNSLPGGVLLIDINEGERVVTAKAIETRSLKKNEMRMPDKGIKTTRKEFQKMRDEQVQRMRANGANVIIRN
jgi:GLPGLI family protein